MHKILPPTDFAEMVLEHLRTAGVHQAEKRDTIHFTALNPWPGEYVGAEGRFMEGETERRAAIFIGPEFGTLSRVDLVAAAREATDARFDALIACAFAFDAHASEVSKLGPLPILKAKMNPDLHMAGDLKNTGKGNLFVVFGEPDIDIEHEERWADQSASEGRRRVRPEHWRNPRPTTSRALRPGSSTPTTTRRASSSATPISSAQTTLTKA